MASYTSAAAQVTSEGTVASVAAALAVLVAAFESDDDWESQIILLPNGLFVGVVINAVLP